MEESNPDFSLVPTARYILGLEYPSHLSLWAQLAEKYKRLLLIASRDHAKTTFFDRILPITRILTNKAYKILLVSYSDAQVLKLGGDIKEAFDSKPNLKEFSPHSEEDWSKSRMKFKDGSLIDTLTFGSSGRGGHYDLILVDDPVKDFGGMNPDDQSRYFTRSLTPMANPGAQIIVTGNYVYDGDLIDRIEKNSAYHTVKFPCINAEGKPLWPERWSLEALEKRRIEIESGDDPFGFSKEYMLEKIDPKAQFFKREMFKFYNPAMVPDRLAKILSLDPAISLDGDDTALMVTGTDEKNKTYLLGYSKLKTDDVQAIIDDLFRLVELYDVPLVQVETIGFQKLFKHWIYEAMREKNRHFGIEEIRTHTKSKQARIMALQPRIAAGSLLFHPTAQEAVIAQFCAFPRGKNDDMCLSGETLIATQFGDVRICDIESGDSVLTPVGMRRVLAAGFTGVKQVKEMRGVSGTANHPIFADGIGFCDIDAFTLHMKTDSLSLWNMMRWAIRRLLYSKELNLHSWDRAAITSVSRHGTRGARMLLDFMLLFGNFITQRKFRKAGTFTIKTATLLTTTFLTWSVYRLSNIVRLNRNVTQPKTPKILPRYDHLPQCGTGRKQEGNGIKITQNNNGSTLKSSIEFVNNVGTDLIRSMARRSFAEANATGALGRFFGCAKTVDRDSQQASIENLDTALQDAGLRPVYNLTIEGAGCYYANGVLVSNCDALSFQIGKWDNPEPLTINPPKDSFEWWKQQSKPENETWLEAMNI